MSSDSETIVGSPFVRHNGIQILERGDGKGRATQTITPTCLNSVGIVHGGVYTALADTVAGVALFSVIGEDQFLVTTDIFCSYFKSAKDGTLDCTAEVVHQSRSAANVEARIFQGDTLLARASVSFVVRRR